MSHADPQGEEGLWDFMLMQCIENPRKCKSMFTDNGSVDSYTEVSI